jgi:hypothetical protein
MPIESARKCAREAALKAGAIDAESGEKSDVRIGVVRVGTAAALGLN